MSRRTVDLEPAHVDALPALAACTGWISPAVGSTPADAEERASLRRTWLREVTAEWGTCGRVVRDGDEPVGYVVYAPPVHLPGLARLPTAPVSPDALVLAELWVSPGLRGGGLGRHLVRAMARDLVDRYGTGVPAVETFSGRADVSDVGRGRPGEPCLRPQGFCEALGFIERREHVAVPRWRLELRSAVDWRGGVGHALERLRAGVRPAPGRRPAVRTTPLTTQPREEDLPGLS